MTFNGSEHIDVPEKTFKGYYPAEVLVNSHPVSDTDSTDDKSGRVKVRVFPMMVEIDVAALPWASPAYPVFEGGASDQGFYNVPTVGSRVWVFFAAGDFNSPVYIANLSGKTDGPTTSEREPGITMWQTSANHRIILDSRSGEEKITIVHKNGEKIVITDDQIQIGSGTLKKLIKEEFKALYDAHVHEYTGYSGGSGSPYAAKSTKPIDPAIPVPSVETTLTGTPKGIEDTEMTDKTRAS